MNEEYAFGDKMPAWMRTFLASKGVPPQFTVDELTDEQREALMFAYTVYELERKGLVKVVCDVPSNPRILLTKRGREVADKLEKKGIRNFLSKLLKLKK